MNKDNASQYLPLVQALADGKALQWCDYEGSWIDTQGPAFADPPERYRIKPELREFWVVCFPDGYMVAYAKEESAHRYARQPAPNFSTPPNIVHCREVQ